MKIGPVPIQERWASVPLVAAPVPEDERERIMTDPNRLVEINAARAAMGLPPVTEADLAPYEPLQAPRD